MLKNIVLNESPVIVRGEIYLAELPYTQGSEQSGKRPVVILSNNTNNRHSSIVNVAAITTKNKPLPVHVYVGTDGGLKTESTVMLEQTMTVDKSKLVHRIGEFSSAIMEKINEALMMQFALI